MDQLLEVVPLIVALLVPPLFAVVKQFVSIPPQWIPVILPAAGGILASIGALVGVDIDPAAATATGGAFEAAVTGVLVGSAGVGVHQIKKAREKGNQL